MPDSELPDPQSLLRFLYQVPVAILEITNDGAIELLNPAASQILLPLYPGNSFENFFEVMEDLDASLEASFKASTAPGPVLNGHLIEVEGAQPIFISVTISRLNEKMGVVILQDVTERETLRRRVDRERERLAEVQGKADAAAIVLHDIGNATTAVATSSSLLFSEENWDEIRVLGRVRELITAKQPELDSALGGGKGAMLQKVLDQLKEKLNARRERVFDVTKRIANGVRHIEEILSIQRTLSGGASGDREQLVDLRVVVRECISLQQSSLDKRRIELKVDLGKDPLVVRIDRTRIIQLINNLFKNAIESFDRRTGQAGTSVLAVLAEGAGERVRLQIRDTGAGFDAAVGEELFNRGNSTKTVKSGIGLGHCRQIAESHGGTLSLSSDGPGTGAVAILELPLSKGKTN